MVQPDGTLDTWSHWDEGGKKFGAYKDGDVIGDTNVNTGSLRCATNSAGSGSSPKNRKELVDLPGTPHI